MTTIPRPQPIWRKPLQHLRASRRCARSTRTARSRPQSSAIRPRSSGVGTEVEATAPSYNRRDAARFVPDACGNSSARRAGCCPASRAIASSVSCSGSYGFILGALLASSAMGTDQTLWMIVRGARRRPGRRADPDRGVLRRRRADRRRHRRAASPTSSAPRSAVSRSIYVRDPVRDRRRPRRAGAAALRDHRRRPRFGGAWTAIVGGARAEGRRGCVAAAARNNVWLAYPMNPAPGQRWVIVVWLALSAAGVIVQLRRRGKAKGKRTSDPLRCDCGLPDCGLRLTVDCD